MESYYYKNILLGVIDRVKSGGVYLYPAHDSEHEEFAHNTAAAKARLRELYDQNKESYGYEQKTEVIARAVSYLREKLGDATFQKLYPHLSTR